MESHDPYWSFDQHFGHAFRGSARSPLTLSPIEAARTVAVHALFFACLAILLAVLLSYALLAAAAYFVFLALTAVPGLLVALPGFLLKCALVVGAMFGVALMFPAAESALRAFPALQTHWPLLLAALVPVPLALLLEAVFFRR